MTHISIGLLLTFTLAFFNGHPPSDNSEIISWQEDRKLTWDDFQGEPDFNYEAVGAITSSGILHTKSCQDGMIEFEVEAYFEKLNSWVKEEARTNHHLIHEQIHFNITELYARRLFQKLEAKAFRCDQEAEFDKFVDKYLLHWESEQINYDLDTHYSMDPERQKEWEYWIAFELSNHKPCHND